MNTLRKMAVQGARKQFPVEASEEFDVVADEKIVEWNQKLRERFGIGQGEMTVVDEPVA